MKLNDIHEGLKELYIDKGKVKSLITYQFVIKKDTERVIKLFKKGYWSLMPFAFGSYNNFAIRLLPSKQIKNSSIVSINRSDAITVASNLKTFLPLQCLGFIDDIEMIKEHFIDRRKEIKEMFLPYQEYTDSLNSMDFFYDYILNENNQKAIEEKREKIGEKIYSDFWNHYNNNTEQKAYFDLMVKLTKNEEWYPKFSDVNYGIWNNRIYNILAQRAYIDLDGEFSNIKEYYWRSLSQAHGFDAERVDFGMLPSKSGNSYLSLPSITDSFHPDLKRTFSKEILEHPLYEATKELSIRKSGYQGEKHIEAAAILDTEHNDPYAAWDALVTASYWAGQAGSKAIEPMWEAAIYLSKKHNWTEIHEVLVQQYEFYNFYKDKV